MYGDHTNGVPGLFGAIREEEEDLGFGHFLKKKIFNKKNLNKAGKFAGNLAKKELERRISNGELTEEELMDLMSMYGDHTNGAPGLFGAIREEEEDLGFGSFLKKKVFNKKNLNKAGKFAGNLAMKELNRRMQHNELSEEEDLYDIFSQLNDNEEESLICKMNENNKCVGLKNFMSKVQDTIKNIKSRKQVFKKILDALKEAKELK